MTGDFDDRRGSPRHDGSRPAAGERSGAPGSRRSRQPRVQTDLLHSDVAREPISRHAVVLGAFGLLLTAGAARLADYQIFNRGRYVAEANGRRLLSQTLHAKRGTIYDRNGNVLASSVECSNVYVNPQLIKPGKRKKAARALAEALGVDEDEALDCVSRDTTFAYVKRRVDQEDAEALMERGIAGIELEPSVKRVYPYGNLASQVLGVVNIDNEGSTGLELYYDDILTGTDGSLVRERARDGSFIAGGAYRKVPARDGMDIVLTIDANIQKAAEEAAAQAVKDASAKYGSIIVTDPSTGEILAACSSPTYDQADLAHATTADMNLRVVTDSYEPGSVFKAFVCGAGIDLGVITPDDTVFDVPATVKAGDDDVSDVDGRDYAMTMTVREILRRSSNTGMVLVGKKIGEKDFADYLERFGFGTSTGIDFPGEAAGIVRKRKDWDGASLASMSFGQAIAVPPVQMVRAMSAIANKGVMTTPHFLKSRQGTEVDWTDGEQRAISADAAAQVADMMRTVVEEGTGTLAQVPGYEVSGKTGTAERAGSDGDGYQAGNNMASFMGFVSTTDPRALCYVTLDGTARNSTAAQPAFRTVMEEALPDLGIEPTS